MMAQPRGHITQTVVSFIQGRRLFYLSAVSEATEIDRLKVFRVLEKLRREGFLETISERKQNLKYGECGPVRRDPRYRRIRNLEDRKRKTYRCERDKIWRTLRYLKRCTRTDIVRLSGCNPASVENYTMLLSRNRIIKPVGKRGREKLWFLIRDTGPKRPRLNERQHLI